MSSMTNSYDTIWNWFWHKRSGRLLFPGLRGGWRLAFDLPLFLLGAYAWYLYVESLPPNSRAFLLSMFVNPFGVIAILCVAAYRMGISYLREQLSEGLNPTPRPALFFPWNTLALCKKQRGRDAAVRILGRVRLVAILSFGIGILLENWKKFHS